MKKQDTINTVNNNDDFSSGLMESYGKWMGGDCFQNTDLPDIHLSEAPFDGMDPQSTVLRLNKYLSKRKVLRKNLLKHNLLLRKRQKFVVNVVVHILLRSAQTF